MISGLYARSADSLSSGPPRGGYIRPTAIGKKKRLFVGAQGVGERSAIIYTVIESCRRRGMDTWTYLRDVLTRLPNLTNRQIEQVTPEAWAKALRSRPTACLAS